MYVFANIAFIGMIFNFSFLKEFLTVSCWRIFTCVGCVTIVVVVVFVVAVAAAT